MTRWAALGRWLDALIRPAHRPAATGDGDATWDPRRLEHRFSVAAPAPGGGERVLTAPEYPGGELDWHAFSVDPGPLGRRRTPPPAALHRTVFPAPVRFSGMPLPRWWAVEDGKTNFAAVTPGQHRPGPADLPRVRAGVQQRLVPAAVRRARGHLRLGPGPRRHRRVRRAPLDHPRGAGAAGLARWSDVHPGHHRRDECPRPRTCSCRPASPEGRRRARRWRRSALVRDENANLVWGVEQTVRLATGEPRPRHRGGGRDPGVPPPPGTHRRAGRAPGADRLRAMNISPGELDPVHPGPRPGRQPRACSSAAPPCPARSTRPRSAPEPHCCAKASTTASRTTSTRRRCPRTGTRLSVAYNRTRPARGPRVGVAHHPPRHRPRRGLQRPGLRHADRQHVTGARPPGQ